MDLGVFCPVVNNHNVVSKNLNHYEPTWDLQRQFVQTAEDAGFKFALSQVTLAGWGGATDERGGCCQTGGAPFMYGCVESGMSSGLATSAVSAAWS